MTSLPALPGPAPGPCAEASPHAAHSGQRVGRGERVALVVAFALPLAFRTDDLWLVGWLATLWVLVGGRWSNRRALAGGLVLGFTFAVSLKTSLLAACLAAAALLAPAVSPAARRGWTARRAASGALAVAAGALVVPSLVVAGFAAAGAFDALVY